MLITASIFKIINTFLFTIYSLFSMGPSTADPITFKDAENVSMSFVVYADPQILPMGYHQRHLQDGFEDMKNADVEFDAIVMAGDLTENGDKASYDIFWEAMEESPIESIILATGNHDLRVNYTANLSRIMGKVGEYLGVETEKPYYSYEVEGYTFVVLGSEESLLDEAAISDEQIAFLDSSLAEATAEGKPAFVICHQPLTDTHGAPTPMGNGDLGEDSTQVREVLEKYENIFLLSGHLHDGITEKNLVVLNEENNVISINLPAFGRPNEAGKYLQMGLGTYVEVYSDEVIFTARDFVEGVNLEGYTMSFPLK